MRSAQRPEIIRRAQAIRERKPHPATVVTDGTLGLAELAEKHQSYPATMLRATAEASANGEYVTALAVYVNTVFATDTVTYPHDHVGLGVRTAESCRAADGCPCESAQKAP